MIEALITFVIYLVVVGLILWLLIYLIDNLPLPPQFKMVGRTVIMVVGVIILILMLLSLLGVTGGHSLPRLR
jgi:hypothetical protein